MLRLLLSTAIFFLLSQSVASAQSVDVLVDRGVTLREQGRDDEAVTVFRQARALEDSARVRTQLGLALLASGEFVEAFELLSEALSARDPWVEARRDAIEASFVSASQHVGILELSGAEPGAMVSVNGRAVGAMPILRPVHALVGQAVVEVTLEGYHRFSTEVSVEAGRTARLRVALVPMASSAGGGGGGSDDWILPVVIAGGVLIVGGVIAAIVVASLPSDPILPEVVGTGTTLEARF